MSMGKPCDECLLQGSNALVCCGFNIRWELYLLRVIVEPECWHFTRKLPEADGYDKEDIAAKFNALAAELGCSAQDMSAALEFYVEAGHPLKESFVMAIERVKGVRKDGY